VDHDDKPFSRREARALRDAHASPAEASSELAPSVESKDPVRIHPESRDRVVKRRRTRRRWIWGVVLVLIIAIIVVSGLAAKRLYDQAMGVRSHLESSISEVTTATSAVAAGDLTAANQASVRLSTSTGAAVDGTKGRLWAFAEGLPFVGPNLAAVRLVAETTDDLANSVVAPASQVNLGALRPHGGGIDLVALEALSPLLDEIDAGIGRASEALASVDRGVLLDQVSSGVEQLADRLSTIQPSVETVRNVMEVLPDALGASGPRTYLLMFQGNSEARSLGGNAASFLVLRAEGGQLTITDQASSSDFRQPSDVPVIPLDAEAVAIYGDKIGRYTPDLTMVPDFPTAVQILEGWWHREGRQDVDAVMSLDPIALSYLLAATGPVPLLSGDTLTAENAASLLLNEPYFRYDSREQNVFFAMAASQVFTKITSGEFSPMALMSSLARSADEGRLLYVSDNPRETELVAGSRMSGILPVDTDEKATIGIFANDNTGSKKSYYLDMNVAICRSDAEIAGTITLASTLTPEIAATLPISITGPYYPAGDISTYVVIYGPAGSQLTQVTLDGGPANIVSAGQHLGRPAAKVEILNNLVSAHTLSFAFSSPAHDQRSLSVWNSPMTRETAITLDEDCG
jgi:hypothetical protein